MSVWEKKNQKNPQKTRFRSMWARKGWNDKQAPTESWQASVLPCSVKDKTLGSSSVKRVFLFFKIKSTKHCPTLHKRCIKFNLVVLLPYFTWTFEEWTGLFEVISFPYIFCLVWSLFLIIWMLSWQFAITGGCSLNTGVFWFVGFGFFFFEYRFITSK